MPIVQCKLALRLIVVSHSHDVRQLIQVSQDPRRTVHVVVGALVVQLRELLVIGV